MHKYHTQGVCASEIDFEVENGLVKNVRFTDGCSGNLEAISMLVEGMPVAEVIKRLRGIVCQNGTSCADQFVIALEDVLNNNLSDLRGVFDLGQVSVTNTSNTQNAPSVQDETSVVSYSMDIKDELT